MKGKRDKTNLLAGSGKEIPGSELDDNQENVESEPEENNSYISRSDDPKDLGEVIRKWESFRYLI
jgi:hypothetical protein